jgi:hypothetical protein
MTEREVAFVLTSAALSQVPLDKYTTDFVFVVGDREYSCSPIIADFLSRTVSTLHESDPTVQQYRVSTEDPGAYFADFLALGRGRPLVITDESSGFYHELAVELGCVQLYGQLARSFADPLSVGNVGERLRAAQLLLLDCDAELSLIAGQFSEFPESFCCGLDIGTLHAILGRRGDLRIPTEDWLYRRIEGLAQKNSDFFELLEHVDFRHLSNNAIQKFVDTFRSRFDHLTPGIWERLCDRLLCGAAAAVEGAAESETELAYSGSPLAGVIAHLTARLGGNPARESAIAVTASDPGDVNGAPENAVDLARDRTFYASKDTEGQDKWLQLDFRGMRVRPTHYTLRSHVRANWASVRSWVLEASGDGQEWTELDRHENIDDLCSQQPRTYPVATETNWRFFRVRQTGPNSKRNWKLAISAIEFFGILVE